MYPFRSALAAVAVVALALGPLSACAPMNIGHLRRAALVLDDEQTVTASYWKFIFTTVARPDGLGVTGKAVPLWDKLPEWVDRLEEMRITAYVANAEGEVVAEATQLFLPRAFASGDALAFDLFFKGVPAAGSLKTVSFGYSSHFTTKARAAQGKPSRFGDQLLVVGEGPLEQR